jgi:hypothetical protein
MNEIDKLDKILLEVYLLTRYRNEYISGNLNNNDIEIIKNSIDYQCYLAKSYILIVWRNLIEILGF